jgi:hypothetical protein
LHGFDQVRILTEDLVAARKSHLAKVKIARELKTTTPMSRQWIADRLRIGSASYVTTLLQDLR